MNGPRQTACFAKGMPKYTFWWGTLRDHMTKLYTSGQLTADNPVSGGVRQDTDERTNGQCSNLRFAPALNEPLQNNELLQPLHKGRGCTSSGHDRRCIAMTDVRNQV